MGSEEDKNKEWLRARLKEADPEFSTLQERLDKLEESIKRIDENSEQHCKDWNTLTSRLDEMDKLKQNAGNCKVNMEWFLKDRENIKSVLNGLITVVILKKPTPEIIKLLDNFVSTADGKMIQGKMYGFTKDFCEGTGIYAEKDEQSEVFNPNCRIENNICQCNEKEKPEPESEDREIKDMVILDDIIKEHRKKDYAEFIEDINEWTTQNESYHWEAIRGKWQKRLEDLK